MAKVLEIDTTAGTAYVSKAVPPAIAADFYFAFRFYAPAASLALYGVFGFIGELAYFVPAAFFSDGINIYNDAGTWTWDANVSPTNTGTLTGDTWFDVEAHFVAAGGPANWTVEWKVDGVSLWTPYGVTGTHPIQTLRLGVVDFAASGGIFYFDDVKLGHGDWLVSGAGTVDWSDGFEGGDLSAWDSTTGPGSASVVDAPSASPPPLEGMVGIAFDDDTLTAAPTWTWIDLNPNLVATWTVDRGRSYELDQNDTGRATVTINDADGILDPLNTSGTYYGKIEPLKQITLRRWNPVTAAWSTRYRGFVEDYDYTEHPSQHFMQLVISCVDGTEILSSIEMQPDAALFGTTPLSPGTVFYDNAQVDDRIIELYTDAGWPALLAVIFSGNVWVQETTYSAGETIWSAILEAADAEFPGVANVYFSRLGELTFHGRYARFDPVAVAASSGGTWVFTHWKCGDSAAVQASITDTAQIRGISFNRGLAKIINQARATPMFIARADVPGQVYADTPSAAIYGVRSWSADDLILEGGKVSNIGDNKAESLLYAQYYVDNFKAPKNRISQLVFKSLPPSDTRAAPLWDLLCGVEISDMVDVHVRHPVGGTITGGFTGESFFVEGIHEVEEPSGSTSYNLTTLTLDVSPQGYYSGFPSAPVGGARATHTASGRAGTVSVT